MRLPVIVVLAALVASPVLAQKLPKEEEQRLRQAMDHYKKGQDAMNSEQLEEAVREFKAAVALDPLMSFAHYRLGQAEMSLRHYPEAEQAFIACRDAHEKIAGMQFSNTEELERRRSQEIEQLQNQISLLSSGQLKSNNPTLPIQLQNRIDELQRNRRKGAADAVRVPAEVYVSLGSAYFRQGKLPEAEKEWKTAADINPKLGESHNNLAALYMMTNQASQADKELKLAEKAGYPVNPRLKDDIKKALKDGGSK
jgi:tetratricopeptide (TPR) repeat protein